MNGFQNVHLQSSKRSLFLLPIRDTSNSRKSHSIAQQNDRLMLHQSRQSQQSLDQRIVWQMETNDSDNNLIVPDVSKEKNPLTKGEGSSIDTWLRQIVPRYVKLPPIRVEDFNLLFYDLFLLINLSVSISFLVIHRMNFEFVGAAFNEGCLMSIFWICSGLLTGAFLNSAVDGHYGSLNTKDGGPKGAGLLAANTFVYAINFRLIFALLVAVYEHRQVGPAIGEQIMQLEIGFGFALMVFWRALHSSYVPRK